MSTSNRSFLITAASGHIGVHLLAHLLSNPATSNHKLVLPTSSASKLREKLPDSAKSLPNIILAEGDVANATWLESLLKEHAVDSVFSNFAGIEELMYTLNLWDACRNASVKHLVFLSAAGDMTLEGSKKALNLVYAAHVAYKFFLEQKLWTGGVPFSWTIIGPTLFFSNDYRSKGYLLGKGYFNEPLGSKGVSRVDPNDIGLAVAKALEDGGQKWAGKKINVGSKELFTAEDTAKTWSEALGREVKAAPTNAETLAELERDTTPHIGAAFARDLALMYRQFEEYPFGITEEDYKVQVEFLGKEPSSYVKFVNDTAAEWKAESK